MTWTLKQYQLQIRSGQQTLDLPDGSRILSVSTNPGGQALLNVQADDTQPTVTWKLEAYANNERFEPYDETMVRNYLGTVFVSGKGGVPDKTWAFFYISHLPPGSIKLMPPAHEPVSEIPMPQPPTQSALEEI